MAERTCHNCVYCCCDPCLWLRWLWAGAPILPQCANHPQWPGQLREVPGVPCRNYRPRFATPPGDVRMVALGDGCYAYVDAADYEWLNQWHWYLDSGYAARHEKGKTILMHRLIMQPPEGMLVDHVDGNRANNCRVNLRVCTRLENTRNRRAHGDSASRFKGVRRCKRTGRWYARLCFRGQRMWLGYFDSEVEAARAYDRQAVELFGAFARPNFPEEWPPERRAQVYAQRQEPDVKTKVRKSEREKGKGKKTSAPAQTRRRRDRRRTTKFARATAPKPQRKGRTRNRKAEGHAAPPQ
jgi:hypothetical protein